MATLKRIQYGLCGTSFTLVGHWIFVGCEKILKVAVEQAWAHQNSPILNNDTSHAMILVFFFFSPAIYIFRSVNCLKSFKFFSWVLWWGLKIILVSNLRKSKHGSSFFGRKKNQMFFGANYPKLSTTI